MALELSRGGWLAELVDFELGAWDAAAARGRTPAELLDVHLPLDARARILAARSLRRGPEDADDRAAFQARFLGHIQVALEVALLAGLEEPPGPRRAGLAAVLAAAAGEVSGALAADPGRTGGGGARAVERALSAAETAFAESAWPPGDPRLGVVLSIGALAIERQLVARLAALRCRRGRLGEPEVRRRLEQAGVDRARLAEALAAQAAAAGRRGTAERKALRRQLAQLRLPRDAARRLRELLRRPRTAREICADAPPRLRPFLVEQLLLAAEALQPPAPEAAAFAEAFAAGAGLAEGYLPALHADAALRAALHRWQDGTARWIPGEIQGLPAEWGEAADEAMEKVSEIFTDNLEAIAQEVRQTGELGQLLAKAARGTALTAAERKRVKVQLIDLAKVVPALAIFAAPGGMLLLPLLARLLPWNVLPSAWDQKGARPPPQPAKR